MRFFLNTVFPARCILCNGSFYYTYQNLLCGDCIQSIKAEKLTYCRSCGRKDQNCQRCLKKRLFNDIQIFRNADFKIIELISVFKFKYYKNLSVIIADIIREDFLKYLNEKDIELVTYVPLHKKVYKKRGFNHLKAILENLIPEGMLKETVVKIKDTPFQTELKAEERALNLKDAFQLEDRRSIENKNVLLFDDILTTGSTVRSVYDQIKKGKPKGIFGYIIAR